MFKPFRSFFRFIETPVSTKWLACFRIALSVFALLKLLILFPVLSDYYGQYGIIQWAVSKASIGDYLPHLGDLSTPVQNWFSISAEQSFQVLFYLYVICLLCLAAGFLTRIIAIACWLLHLYWMDTGGAFVYGVDVFTQIAFFYLIFIPSNKYWSVDILLRLTKEKAYSLGGGIVKRVLQLQLCLVYLSTGIEKSLSAQWWNGEAIWRAFMIPSFRQFDVSWMSHYTFIPMLIGWLTVAVELSYAFLVWIPKVRVAAVTAVILLHLGIGMFMGLWLFSCIMTLLSLFCFGRECLQDITGERVYHLVQKPFLKLRSGYHALITLTK